MSAIAPSVSPQALALAIANPGALGSIDTYITAVNRLPLLSAEREVELGRRLRDQDDLEAAREMVLSHLRLVVSIARQYMGYGLPQADLIQEGNVGLMKAVRRFDPERGVRLVSFAMHWIKAEIHDYILRNWRMVKVATTKAQRKLFFNLRSLKTGEGSLTGADIERIARELDVRPDDVREMETRLGGHDLALEASSDGDDDHPSPISWLSDDGHHEPARLIERQQYDQLQGPRLASALESLDARSRHIIEARWLQDEAGETLQSLAAHYGVSAERIRQIEVRALAKLRDALGAQALLTSQ